MTDQTKDAIERVRAWAESAGADTNDTISLVLTELDRLARENERLQRSVASWEHDARIYATNADDHKARAERLAEALRYMVQVREIKCEHKHPPPDDFCAKCKADTALATLSPKAEEK